MIMKADRWLIETVFEPLVSLLEWTGADNIRMAKFFLLLAIVQDAVSVMWESSGYRWTLLGASMAVYGWMAVAWSRQPRNRSGLANYEKFSVVSACLRMFVLCVTTLAPARRPWIEVVSFAATAVALYLAACDWPSPKVQRSQPPNESDGIALRTN